MYVANTKHAIFTTVKHSTERWNTSSLADGYEKVHRETNNNTSEDKCDKLSLDITKSDPSDLADHEFHFSIRLSYNVSILEIPYLHLVFIP